MDTVTAWSFERVAGPFNFTEGPLWDGEALLFTDIPSNRIMRYRPAGEGQAESCTEYRTDTEGANGLTFDLEGRLIACAGKGRRVVRYEADGSVTTLADRYQGRRLNSPNDVVVDSRGRVWFTDPGYGDRSALELDHDSVYRLDPQPGGSWTITRVTTDTIRPNGLAFSPDEGTLYLAESPPGPIGQRQLRAYPVGPDGSLGPHRVLHDFGAHRGIDGMRVDSAGDIVASCRLGPGRAGAPDRRLRPGRKGAGRVPGAPQPHQLRLRRRRPAHPLRHRLHRLAAARPHRPPGR